METNKYPSIRIMEDGEKKQIFNYTICRTIGKGGFGRVYEVKNRADQRFYALKMEIKGQSRKNSMLNEVQAYKDLQGCEEIPCLVDHGVHEDTNFIVLPLFRHSLKDLLEKHPKFFTRKSATIIAKKLLKATEFIHSRGRLYRDFKPENVMLSHNNKIYLIDFGMSRSYINEDGSHILESKGKNMSGTAWYVSRNTHLGIEQSRRDDLESLFYLLILLYKSKLPWMQLEASTSRDRQIKIGQMKGNVSEDELCSGIPGKEQLVKFIQHVRNLGFTEEPNYRYLNVLLNNVLCEEKLYHSNLNDQEPTVGVAPISIWTKIVDMFSSSGLK